MSRRVARKYHERANQSRLCRLREYHLELLPDSRGVGKVYHQVMERVGYLIHILGY